MQINLAVKKIRELMGESQQVFATRLGISIRGLANYESDRIPPLVVLGKLQQLTTERKDVPKAITSAINAAFLRELPKGIGARRGLVTFAFSVDGDGGLVFEILNSAEEYAYAMAFQHSLRESRQGKAEAKAALNALFDKAGPLMEKGEHDWLSKFITEETK